MVTDFQQRCQDHLMGKNSLVKSKNGAGKTRDTHMQKNEVGPLCHTIHKNSLKMDQQPNF